MSAARTFAALLFTALVPVVPLEAQASLDETRRFVDRWIETGRGGAAGIALEQCPEDSERHAYIFETLLALPLVDPHLDRLAVTWGAAHHRCHQVALVPWYASAMRATTRRETARSIGSALGGMDVPEALVALREAALDATIEDAVQTELLSMALAYSDWPNRIALFAEALQSRLMSTKVVRLATPHFLAEEHRDEFAERAVAAAALAPDTEAARYVLIVVMHEAANSYGASRLSLDASGRIADLVLQRRPYDRMDESVGETVRRLAEAARRRAEGSQQSHLTLR